MELKFISFGEPTLSLSRLKETGKAGHFTASLKLMSCDRTSLDSVHNGHHELLGMLLSYFEQSVADAGTSRVSRKLYTALVSFFLQPDSRQPSWFRLVLLGNSYAAAIKSGDSDAFVRIFIRSMDPRRFKALLVLCTTMTEETIKTEPRHATTYNLAQRLTQNAEDIWRLLLSALTFVHPQSSLLSEVDYEEFGASARSPISDGQDLDRRAPAVAEQALGFLQIWITFSLDNVSKQQDDVRIMARKCVDLAAASVRLHELTARAIETLISVVESAPNLLHINDNPVLLGALTCEEAKGLVESLEQGEFETENIRFATFLVELADTQEFDTPDFLNNPILVQTLRHLQTLLKCKGVPGIDDEVCSMAMDIWTKVAGGLSDWVSHDQTSLEMKRLLVSCIDACVERMKFPDSADWDADDRSKVNQFERDLEDLLLATYSSLGFDLWLKAANQTLSSLASEQWQDFAASLFCLCALAEAVSDEESLNDHIKNVVGTPNWVRICQQGILPDEKARKWMTTFVASYSHYFQSHLEHLLPVMNFLFNSLLPSSSRSAASRAISTLCQVCRSTLTHNLYDLLQSIENIRWVSIEDEERLFRATAAVIQSLRPESAKYSPLRRLIDIPAREFHEVIHAGPEESEWAQNVSVNVLRKLAQIGKGLRAPEEEPIDLDVEPHDHANPRTEDFWFSGAGRDLKGDICKLIAGLAAKFPTNGQIIEGVCEVLKAGYTETRPSPFGFLPQITRDFFVAFCKPSTPSVSTVFATVSAFLASHAHKPQAIREDFLVIVKAIHENQFALLRRSVDPEIVDDHEFSYSSLDFLTKLLPSYGPIFFDITDTALGIPSNLPSNSTEFGRQQFWQVIFLFSLRQLGGSDTFPKRSAAQFWVSSALLRLSRPPSLLIFVYSLPYLSFRGRLLDCLHRSFLSWLS